MLIVHIECRVVKKKKLPWKVPILPLANAAGGGAGPRTRVAKKKKKIATTSHTFACFASQYCIMIYER
jgi:hypothetical protein